MLHNSTARIRSIFPVTLLVLALLSACAPATPVVNFPADVAAAKPTTVLPTAAVIEPTDKANEPAAQPVDAAPFALDLNGLAEKIILETIPAVQPSDDAAYWAVLPEYKAITLYGGYPMGKHAMAPQIFIYPTKDLAVWNQNANKQYDNLRAVLASRPVEAVRRCP